MLRRCLFVALALHITQALAQSANELLVVNGMENSIVELVISPPNLGIWSGNLLPPPPLEPGEVRKIKAWPFAEQCVQDVRGTFAVDGEKVIWKSLRLCNVKKLGLFRDRNSGQPFATFE